MASLDISLCHNLQLTATEFNVIIRALNGRSRPDEQYLAATLADRLVQLKISHIDSFAKSNDKLKTNLTTSREGAIPLTCNHCGHETDTSVVPQFTPCVITGCVGKYDQPKPLLICKTCGRTGTSVNKDNDPCTGNRCSGFFQKK